MEKIKEIKMKKILVCGATGFIGNNIVTALKKEGHYVVGADIQPERYKQFDGDFFFQFDLRQKENWEFLFQRMGTFDEIIQLAADMGGAGYVFTGIHDANIMHNSALINLNLLSFPKKLKKTIIFYSSSACMYPAYNQKDSNNPNCKESSAYPANPDSEYGWEKLFSERLYLSFIRNYGLNIKIARFHNIFGIYGSWNDGKEKAPAAFCRKIAKAKLQNKDSIDMWGDGEQTRSFLYIDECIKFVRKLMASDCNVPVNIGSEEIVTINQLAEIIMDIANYKVKINHIIKDNLPLGVRGRNSDNELINKKLGECPNYSLEAGLKKTYPYIEDLVRKELNNETSK